MTSLVKHNPGFLSDREVIEAYCVRINELDSIKEMLLECDQNSNPHRIVIGPRGSGKTMLLRRVAAEIRLDSYLTNTYIPVVFSEESYSVSTANEFWLEALLHLSEQSNGYDDQNLDLRLSYRELRSNIHDDSLGNRCLSAMLQFAHQNSRRLVLIVENLNMIFDQGHDDMGWQLRQVLQNEKNVILLASATSQFDEIVNPDCALYNQFVSRQLPALDAEECQVLWNKITGQNRSRRSMKGLRILTGGNPRLLAVLARFGSDLSFSDLMQDLRFLIDDLTTYFKAQIESLPQLERRVYLALAEIWEPATAREVAYLARTDVNKCSAQLNRLIKKGAVEFEGGTDRRKLYYVSERLFNIYYLLRRAHSTSPVVEALIAFMEEYYTTPELIEIAKGMVREIEDIEDDELDFIINAFRRLVNLPQVADDREHLLEWTLSRLPNDRPVASHIVDLRRWIVGDLGVLAPQPFEWFTAEGASMSSEREQEIRSLVQEVLAPLKRDNSTTQRVETIGRLVRTSEQLLQQDCPVEALLIAENVMSVFSKDSNAQIFEQCARVLLFKGAAFGRLREFQKETECYEEAIVRSRKRESKDLRGYRASALMNKGLALSEMDRYRDAIACFDELVSEFRLQKAPQMRQLVAEALANKAAAFHHLDELEQAVEAYSEVDAEFSETPTLEIRQITASVLIQKAWILFKLDRHAEALTTDDLVIGRYGEESDDELSFLVACAMQQKALELKYLERLEDAVSACHAFVDRFKQDESSDIRVRVVQSSYLKIELLRELNNMEEAIDEAVALVEQFAHEEIAEIRHIVANTLFDRASMLSDVGNLDAAIRVIDELEDRFLHDDTHEVREALVRGLVMKCKLLVMQQKSREALKVCDHVEEKFGSVAVPSILVHVAWSYLSKGLVLMQLNDLENARNEFSRITGLYYDSDNSLFDSPVEEALILHATIEIGEGEQNHGIETIGRLLNRHRQPSNENRCKAHLLRAKALLTLKKVDLARDDIEKILELLPECRSFLSETLEVVTKFALRLGIEDALELIAASNSKQLLMPLSVAFELELGRNPRASREVRDLANDIRVDIRKLRPSAHLSE